jgi:porphobilinogen synthase
MDGVFSTVRTALDGAGFKHVLTMPYCAKFACHPYGPSKAAARSAPLESLHATHQINGANASEALSSIEADIISGADIVIVKPALTSLDIIRAARLRFDVPIAAFSESPCSIMHRVCL